MKKPKVLVADPISDRGVEELERGGSLEVIVRTGLKGEDLLNAVADVEGIVVRSQTKISAEVIAAAPLLKAVGRAGVGVDNVDVDAATRRGVVVMNTPGGNTISTAEHAFSLLMALARKIPQAHASVVAGKWDRKSFEGVELNGKNLAIFGMGRIGTEISRRAIAFGMRVYAYDPYIAASRARSLQVELVDNVDELLPLADFITLHMPLTPETHHMIDRRRLGLARRGVRIVNCARGGLIDEAALLEALESGQVAGAALDVYEVEPPPEDFALRNAPGMVFTPHLGASTAEAQESVGIEIADTMRALLLDGVIRNAVNMPNVDKRTLEAIGHYIAFGERLGRFLAQTAPRRCDVLEITFRGPVNEYDTTPISRAVLKGFLENVGGKEVNIVNAPGLAANLGMKVIEAKLSSQGDYTELLEISAKQEETMVSVAGTFFGAIPRIVNVNGRFVEAKPEGTILMLENRDRPGIVGQIGTLLGEHAVNIAGMSLGRTEKGGRALTLLNLDTLPPAEVVERLYADPDIFDVRTLTL
ncbi:MAG: phosphoglycerate dehydrogenase [Verrucomicrobiia bacterium]